MQEGSCLLLNNEADRAMLHSPLKVHVHILWQQILESIKLINWALWDEMTVDIKANLHRHTYTV